MKVSLWGGDTSQLGDPAPKASYAGVLRVEPVSTSFQQAISGILVTLAGYAIALPVIAWLVLGATWVLRGRPGTFVEYRTDALRFEYLEGMFASHLAIGSVIILTMFVVRYVHHIHPRWLCSVQPGFRWRYAVICGLIAIVGLNGVYWISSLGDPPTWNPDQDFVWWALVILLTAPLQAAGEEFLFRGYLLQAAGAVGRSPWLAVAISAAVFTALHGTQNLPLMVDRFGFGLLAGALVVVTGGLEAAVAVHAVNNVFAFGYAAAAGGIAQARTVEVSTWATTGWNLLSYCLVALVAWFVGQRMRVATRTPGLDSGRALR